MSPQHVLEAEAFLQGMSDLFQLHKMLKVEPVDVLVPSTFSGAMIAPIGSFPSPAPYIETNTGFYNFTAAASFQTSTLARVICLYRLHILQSNDSKRGSRRPGIIFLYLLLLLLQFLTVTLREQ